MKKLLFVFVSTVLLFAGCAKEQISSDVEGGLMKASFTATMDLGSKAVTDGQGANVNRCVMEIFYGTDDKPYGRYVAKVTSGVATFSNIEVVANRAYKVAFWADCVADATTDAGLGTDQYYDTQSLKAVSFIGTYAGNKDARDAFFGEKEWTPTPSAPNSSITIKRPFAQVNVIATDWASVKGAELAPTHVNVVLNDVYTTINALDGSLSNVQDLTYSAAVYENPGYSVSEATLSMDYLLAATEKAVVDINWEANQGTAGAVSHTFSAVPYQRNYRTNIKGALLSLKGQWTVTVDPIWEGSFTEIVEVKDIKSANEAIEQNKNADNLEVKFSAEPNDSGVPTGDPSSPSRAILTTPMKTGAVLSIEVMTNTNTLYVGDYAQEYNVSSTTAANSATVNINVPTGTQIGTLVVNALSKSVYVNGKQVSSVGTINNLDAITSDNTLVVAEDQTVGTLIIRQGGLKIFGTVNAAQAIPSSNTSQVIFVRDCDDISTAVYNVLEPHIDVDNGYVSKDNGDGTWDIYQGEPVAQIGQTKYYTLAKAVEAANATSGATIQLLKDVSIAATLTIEKDMTLDLDDHTVTCFVSAGRPLLVKSNTAFTIKDGVFADGVNGASYGAVDTRIAGIAQDNVTISVSNVDFGVFDNDGNCTTPFNTDNGAVVKFRGTGVCSFTDVRVGTDHYVFDHLDEVATTVVGGKFIVNHNDGDGCSEQPSVFCLYGTNDIFTNVEVQAINCISCLIGASTLTNCTMTNTNYAVTTAYDETITINGGTYTGGVDAVRVMSSGGTVNINDGSFTGASNALFANVTPSQYPSAVATINVLGGKINGDMTTSSSPCYINLYGGVYSVEPATTDAKPGFGFFQAANDDPQTSAQYPWKVATGPVQDAEVSYTKTGIPTAYSSLAAFRDATNAGNTFAGYTVTLLKDIDLNNEEWTPISNYAYGKGSDKLFAGTFDGGNHTISNLKISNNTQDALGNTSDLTNAFFGQVATCTIQNLKISNANVSGTGLNAAVLSLHTVSSGKLVMDNVQVLSGSVTNKDNAGGLACFLTGWADFTNCVNYASVSGYGAGGIVGMLRDNSATHTCTIDNCVNYGAITNTVGGGDGAGGIVSKINNSGSITNCKNYGTITGTVGNVYAGGIIGLANPNYKTFTISDCINYGEISSDAGDYARAGGILGSYGGSLTISRCVNTANVTGYQGAGGIDGWNGDSWGLVINHSYNSGIVNASHGSAGGIDQGNINQTVSSSVNNGAVTCASGSKAWQISNSSSTITSCYYYDSSVLKENSGTPVDDVNAAITALNSGLSTPFWGKDSNNIVKPLVLIQP